MMASVPGPSIAGMALEAAAERLPGFGKFLAEVVRDESGALRIGPRWKPRNLKTDLANPKTAGACTQAANQIEKHLGGAEAGAQRVTITPKDGAPVLGGYRNQSTAWTYHDVVVQDGRVYDAYTGVRGLSIPEYKALWDHPDAIDFGF
jgi:hypothetical protein